MWLRVRRFPFCKEKKLKTQTNVSKASKSAVVWSKYCCSLYSQPRGWSNGFLRRKLMCKPVNSNVGWESSLPIYVPLLPWLSHLRAAWLVWTQPNLEMSSCQPKFEYTSLLMCNARCLTDNFQFLPLNLSTCIFDTSISGMKFSWPPWTEGTIRTEVAH